MIEERAILILGAGPAGLACAHELARCGRRPLLVERGEEVGGLMRSIERGPFVVDIGRKELYSRIPEVHDLWSALLGADYRAYEHREGVLYRGRILETDDRARGPLRGLGLGLGLAIAGGLVRARLVAPMRRGDPPNYEAWCYRRRGATQSRVFSQGFDEKFTGVAWRDRPVPESAPRPNPTEAQRTWRHPARGTGQICSLLRAGIERMGGEIRCDTDVVALRAERDRIVEVRLRDASGESLVRAGHVVSTVPLELLGTWLGVERDATATSLARRSTALVYLFFDEPPRFPHSWLRVTCPRLRAGRITNYRAFGGDMVPEGSTALCVEYFCDADDPLLRATDDELRDLALGECAGLAPGRAMDSFALRLPLANAAASWRDWQTPARQRLLALVRGFGNLYDAHRPGTDKATAAGLEAAAAIASGDRSRFDARVRADRMEVEPPPG